MSTLRTFSNQSKVISGSSSIKGSFLILTISIQSGREIIGFRDKLILQIINCTFGTLQVTLVLEILVGHYQRQSSRRSTATGTVYDRKIILELTGEATVSILETEETVQNYLQTVLPFGMFTLVLLLVSQIIKNGIHTFRLAADTEIRLFKVTVIMDNLIEKTGRRETV